MSFIEAMLEGKVAKRAGLLEPENREGQGLGGKGSTLAP